MKYEKNNDMVDVFDNDKKINSYSQKEIETMIQDHQEQINYIQTLINEKQKMLEVLNGN